MADDRERPGSENEIAPPEPGADPVLATAVYELIQRCDPGSAQLASELRRLRQGYGDAVYSELLGLLCHLRFEPPEARAHWDRIREEREAMESRLGARVDLRVAVLRYFLQVQPELRNPKIIEFGLFRKTQESAYLDDLTRLFNYRVFRERLDHEIRRGERYGSPLSLLMVDLDDFKDFNDRYGHESGNEALSAVARLLARELRDSDVPARYGGEEFGLILPSTGKVEARKVGERARAAVATHPFGPAEATVRLTVSVGVATHPGDALDAAELVRCADRALYVAKADGKNRVHLFGEDRRSFRRLEVRLPGTCTTLGAPAGKISTLNLCDGGVLIESEDDLEEGTLLDLEIRLPDGAIHATGRAVRIASGPGGTCRAAIRLLEVGAQDRLRLLRFLKSGNPEREGA